jgi:SAM-dependent methyltransferase
LLKRSSISHINRILEKNSNWKILDVGCGFGAHKSASVIADIKDFSKLYKDKKFVLINDKKLPFKDKEFDFVIASHVIEHVQDFEFFIKELQRISSKGYIELPSRLGDNLVFENANDHIWWFRFDDISNYLIVSKRNQILSPFITVSMAKLFESIFRESLVIELIWENTIEYQIDESLKKYNLKKISFWKIFRKYLSKRLRSILK